MLNYEYFIICKNSEKCLNKSVVYIHSHEIKIIFTIFEKPSRVIIFKYILKTRKLYSTNKILLDQHLKTKIVCLKMYSKKDGPLKNFVLPRDETPYKWYKIRFQHFKIIYRP